MSKEDMLKILNIIYNALDLIELDVEYAYNDGANRYYVDKTQALSYLLDIINETEATNDEVNNGTDE